MLALYQPHNVLWFLPVSLTGALVFAVLCSRRKMPGPATRLQLASWGVAAGGIVGMIALSTWDKYQLRRELQEVKPAEASHVVVARGTESRAITNPADAARVLELLTSAKGVAAHHSHPVAPVTVSFEYRGDSYGYRVGRDSAVPEEFWVIALNPGCTQLGERELGRLRTSEWAPLIDGLLKENK